MPGKPVKDRPKRNAIARIISGQSTPKDEAQRLGVDERTVERWVSTARGAIDAANGATSDGASPPGTVPSGGEKGPNPALDAARAAASGGAGASSAAPIGPTDIAVAREDMAKTCIEQISTLKQAVGGMLVTFRYSPPLDLADAEVQRALSISPICEAAIRANAEKLYPMLVKMMSGPYQIFAALALEGLMLMMGLKTLAVKKGWEPPKEKSDKPQRTAGAVGGSPTALRDQIEAAREKLGKPELRAVTPDTSSPTVGTINAPSAA